MDGPLHSVSFLFKINKGYKPKVIEIRQTSTFQDFTSNNFSQLKDWKNQVGAKNFL